MNSKTQPVYAIVQLKIHDKDAYFNDYAAHLAPIGQRHGVERVAVSQEPEVIEGTYGKDNTIILKFPSRAEFDAWYSDPEYQPLKDIRFGAIDLSQSTIILVPEFEA